MNVHLPAPNGTFDDVDLVFSLIAVFSSSLLLLASTVIWLLIDLVLTTFWVAVVSVQVDVPPVVWLLRNNKIDGDLSMRLSVCNKIGPSFDNRFDPFFFNRCWNMIDPSGMLLPVLAAVVTVATLLVVNVDVANVFDVVAFFNACVECSSAAVPLIVFPFNVCISPAHTWLLVVVLVVMLAVFFNVDWITNLFDSVDKFGVVAAATLVSDAFLCSRIDGEFDVLHVRLSSSLLAMLTAPLFNKLNKSCPFCKIIWPFSVRAPRIKIILLGWCDCYSWKLNLKKKTTNKQTRL